MESYVIVGDFQVPYHDPLAVEVAAQIAEDVKPRKLVINGDFGDYRVMGTHPMRQRDGLLSQMAEELERQHTVLRDFVNRVKPQEILWNDGNHEWRVVRAMSQSPQTAALLGIESVEHALSTVGLLALDKLPVPVRYSGEYPEGCWLRDDLPPEQNVWVEHGLISRKNAGFTANALLGDRMTNVITGHVERLAGPLWKKVVGNRFFFGVEGGSLSIIATPRRPQGVYNSAVFNSPSYLNHQQGIVVVYHEGDMWTPYAVPIQDGVALFNGRLYRG